MASNKESELKRIFNNGLWADGDYRILKKEADDAASKAVPMLTKLATAVDIRGCGSLGTRSVRKQIQALCHFAIGNQKMRVNANTLVPSTCALVISGKVGSGKSLYHTWFEEVIGMMRKATEVLDKQIHEKTVAEEMKQESCGEQSDLVQLLSGRSDGKPKKANIFKCRQMLRSPGTKEGWEKSLEVENRMIQLINEGDD